MRMVYDVITDGTHDGSPEFPLPACACDNVGGAMLNRAFTDCCPWFVLMLQSQELPFNPKFVHLHLKLVLYALALGVCLGDKFLNSGRTHHGDVSHCFWTMDEEEGVVVLVHIADVPVKGMFGKFASVHCDENFPCRV